MSAACSEATASRARAPKEGDQVRPAAVEATPGRLWAWLKLFMARQRRVQNRSPHIVDSQYRGEAQRHTCYTHSWQQHGPQLGEDSGCGCNQVDSQGTSTSFDLFST